MLSEIAKFFVDYWEQIVIAVFIAVLTAFVTRWTAPNFRRQSTSKLQRLKNELKRVEEKEENLGSFILIELIGVVLQTAVQFTIIFIFGAQFVIELFQADSIQALSTRDIATGIGALFIPLIILIVYYFYILNRLRKIYLSSFHKDHLRRRIQQEENILRER